jgi:hypothetical protein
VVTALGCFVVFVVLELSVQPVKRTQEIRSNIRPDTSSVFVFIVLTEPGDYFKKSFYSHLLFQYHSAGPDSWIFGLFSGKKERKSGEKFEKKPGMIILPSFQAV